jgi:PIN domain nuclease of toxin-antitoxin system
VARRSPKDAAWIAGGANSIWVSAATAWEIAIKHMVAKKSMPISGRQVLRYFRMLVAQAEVEALKLVTSDALLAKHGKSVIAV